MLAKDAKKDALINMRVHSSTRDFIDRAAKSIGKDRSDFMLDAACEKARDISKLAIQACYKRIIQRPEATTAAQPIRDKIFVGGLA